MHWRGQSYFWVCCIHYTSRLRRTCEGFPMVPQSPTYTAQLSRHIDMETDLSRWYLDNGPYDQWMRPFQLVSSFAREETSTSPGRMNIRRILSASRAMWTMIKTNKVEFHTVSDPPALQNITQCSDIVITWNSLDISHNPSKWIFSLRCWRSFRVLFHQREADALRCRTFSLDSQPVRRTHDATWIGVPTNCFFTILQGVIDKAFWDSRYLAISLG